MKVDYQKMFYDIISIFTHHGTNDYTKAFSCERWLLLPREKDLAAPRTI